MSNSCNADYQYGCDCYNGFFHIAQVLFFIGFIFFQRLASLRVEVRPQFAAGGVYAGGKVFFPGGVGVVAHTLLFLSKGFCI